MTVPVSVGVEAEIFVAMSASVPLALPGPDRYVTLTVVDAPPRSVIPKGRPVEHELRGGGHATRSEYDVVAPPVF